MRVTFTTDGSFTQVHAVVHKVRRLEETPPVLVELDEAETLSLKEMFRDASKDGRYSPEFKSMDWSKPQDVTVMGVPGRTTPLGAGAAGGAADRMTGEQALKFVRLVRDLQILCDESQLGDLSSITVGDHLPILPALMNAFDQLPVASPEHGFVYVHGTKVYGKLYDVL